MEKTYRNDLSELARLSADIEAFCEANTIDFESANALQLCLDEAVTNVISYAWDNGAAHEFAVSLAKEFNVVKAVVRDDGRAFDPVAEGREPDLSASLEEREIGGLGIHFCRTLMQRLDYRREDGKYNVFTMERALG